MRDSHAKRARPISVKLLVLLNLLIVAGCLFMAYAATGRLNEQLAVGSDSPSPVARILTSNGLNASGGMAMRPLASFSLLALASFVVALAQLRGKGFGWTFNTLLSLGGIAVGFLLTLTEFRQSGDGQPVILGPVILGVSLIGFFLLVEPNTQSFFGRFEPRE